MCSWAGRQWDTLQGPLFSESSATVIRETRALSIELLLLSHIDTQQPYTVMQQRPEYTTGWSYSVHLIWKGFLWWLHMSSRMAQSKWSEHVAFDSVCTKDFPCFFAHRTGCQHSGALISSCEKAFFFLFPAWLSPELNQCLMTRGLD